MEMFKNLFAQVTSALKQKKAEVQSASRESADRPDKATHRPTVSTPPVKGVDALDKVAFPASLDTVASALEQGGASEWTIQTLHQEGIDHFESADDVKRVIGRIA